MICPKCGAETRKKARFCTGCGVAKDPHLPRKRMFSTTTGIRTVAVAIGLILVVMALVVGRWGRTAETRPEEPIVQATGRPVSLAVRGVASKFLCSCGECSDLELADCTCPTAVEGREFIDRELKRGRPEPKLLEMVKGRYGRIKTQYASLLGGPGERPAGASAIPPAIAKPSGSIATEADAPWIVSRFICPCDQCQNHALSECDCKHPKGATEVKAFIRYKISQKQHTAEEIVKAVAGEYGHQIKG